VTLRILSPTRSLCGISVLTVLLQRNPHVEVPLDREYLGRPPKDEVFLQGESLMNEDQGYAASLPDMKSRFSGRGPCAP